MKRSSRFHFLLTVTAVMLMLSGIAQAADFETLRPGFEGDLVRALQSGLQFVGFPLTVDGKYGSQTEAAVLAFQRRQNLTADGLAGQRTLTELYRLAPQFMPAAGLPTGNTAPSPTENGTGTAPAAQPAGGHAYVYTGNGGSLNLRNRPSYGQTTIAQLPFGTEVEVLSVSGSWTRVRALGRTGYVLSTYLRSSPASQPSATPPPAQGGTVNNPPASAESAQVITANLGSLNLRASASAGARVLMQIPYQAVVQVRARLGTWAQVSYANLNGFVMTRFLRFGTAPAQNEGAVQPPAPEIPAASGYAIVNNQPGRTLNLRNSPSQSNNIIGQIPSGTRLQLISRGETWSEVIFQTTRGFVMSSFLRFETAATETPPAAETPAEQPETPEPAPEVFARILRPGSKGEDVRELQTRLAALKYTVSINSSYDAMTEEAVRHFQQQNSLKVDGIFGSESAALLLSGSARLATDKPLTYQTLRIDNNNQAVSAMQTALKALGFPLTVNGRYDIPTHQAVVGFQQRNGLPITGVANAVTQAAIFSSNAKGYSVSVPELGASEGKVGGPATSQVRLLHWFNDIKPRVASGQKVTVYHPASGISFTIRFYSLGKHADSEPATWRDTQLMNRAFGTPSWNINPVYVKLPDGRWTLAAMHNRPHLTGAVSANGFGGHLCIHFLRDMDEVLRNDPDYGASNQRAIRKAWQGMTGEVVE